MTLTRTLGYFLSRGALYGLILGIYAGTGFMPIIGTVMGGIYGLVMGIGTGLICALVTHRIHSRTFHEDLDLEAYSRHLARVTGIGAGVTALGVLWLSLAALIAFLDTIPEARMGGDFIWIIFFIVAGPAFVLANLSAAYTASDYPAWSAQRLKRGHSVEINQAPAAAPDRIYPTFRSLIKSPKLTEKRVWTIYGGSVLFAYAGLLIGTLISRPPVRLEDAMRIVFVVPMGMPFAILAAALTWVYCAFGNAMALSFLKRGLYRAYLPNLSAHWYRISLTLISFALTWAMIWWTTIPGPVLATIMAVLVYRRIALPNETPEKAKRKEKNTLALEDAETEEGQGLLMESEPLLKIQQR